MVSRLAKPLLYVVLALSTQVPVASALSDAQKNLFNRGVNYFDAGAVSCSSGSGSVTLDSTSNSDYAGRSILNQGELKALDDNAPTYQQAAAQAGIPWQILAAMHYREHSFLTTEPDSKPFAVGVYQITYSDSNRQKYNLDGPNYPAAGQQLSAEEFLAQSIDAASFIKADGAGLSASSEVAAIKDAFVKYNGEPQKYIEQATALGYTGDQGYEGSPYVMNIADPPRDPSSGPKPNWVQSRGGDVYTPATADQYGAFIVYASIANISVSGGSCLSGNSVNCSANGTQDFSPVRQNVVCLAQAELAKWNANQLKPGKDFETYSQGRPEDWCADFASWIYNQAAYPLGDNWNVPLVHNIRLIGEQNQNFHWHLTSGYVPKPGDLAIHGTDEHHVNIVVGITGNKVTLIGGNQGSNDFYQSSVSKAFDSGDIIGYVSPD